MLKNILEAVIIIGVPIIILVGSGWAMLEVSGRNEIVARRGSDLPKPLNSRPFGYGVTEVNEFWEKLGPDGRPIELRFLRIDLLFPFLYCAAIAFGLAIAWQRVGITFSILPILAVVLLVLISDLTENLIHIDQLQRVIADSSHTPRSTLIQIASLATILKIWLIGALGLALLILSGIVASGSPKQ